MTTQRWVLTEVDTGDTWTMPINPDSMTSPVLERSMTTTYGSNVGTARLRTFVTPSRALDWSWSGVIRTKAHHDALEAWSRKPGKVRVTDHLGRTFEVMLQGFEPTDRKPTPTTPWRLRYTMKTLLLRRIA